MKTVIFIGFTLVVLAHCQANVDVALSNLVRREIDSALNSCTWTSCEDNSTQLLINKLDAISTKLDTLQQRLNMRCPFGFCSFHPASSCAEILEEYPDSSSGYYWVSNATSHAHRVYCDMTRSCGGVTGGWMRVAYLDMTNSSHQCPSSLYQRTDSGVRSCAVKTTYSGSCSSVWYLPRGISYSRVCGKVIGYHIGTADAFNLYGRTPSASINSNYVDGVSLTYGRTIRQHIWSFASRSCPCGTPPTFVGNNYFCDGKQSLNIGLTNPIWDGEGCGSNSCCTFNNPPWFYRHLPQTTDDIEMRVCRDQERINEDVALKAVEIYVQ